MLFYDYSCRLTSVGLGVGFVRLWRYYIGQFVFVSWVKDQTYSLPVSAPSCCSLSRMVVLSPYLANGTCANTPAVKVIQRPLMFSPRITMEKGWGGVSVRTNRHTVTYWCFSEWCTVVLSLPRKRYEDQFLGMGMNIVDAYPPFNLIVYRWKIHAVNIVSNQSFRSICKLTGAPMFKVESGPGGGALEDSWFPSVLSSVGLVTSVGLGGLIGSAGLYKYEN